MMITTAVTTAEIITHVRFNDVGPTVIGGVVVGPATKENKDELS